MGERGGGDSELTSEGGEAESGGGEIDIGGGEGMRMAAPSDEGGGLGGILGLGQP